MIRFGTVAEVDLGKALCRVQSGDVLSDFVPWQVPRVSGVIEWSAPAVGEQVMLLAPEGDLDGAIAMRGIYSTAFPAPSSVATVHLVRYPDGAEIQYDHASHALTATLPGGGTATLTASGGVTVNADAGVTINGPLAVNGDVSISGTATAQVDVVGGGKSLKGHKHVGVQTGGGVTGAPQ